MQFLFIEFAEGKRPAQKQKLIYKDCIANILKKVKSCKMIGKSKLCKNRIELCMKTSKDIRRGLKVNNPDNLVAKFDITSNECGHV